MKKQETVPKVLKKAKESARTSTNIACGKPWDKGHWSNRK